MTDNLKSPDTQDTWRQFETDAAATRAIKAALRKAFPAARFSITRGGTRIEWTDDGPLVEQVKTALRAADCVDVRAGWKNEQHFEVRGSSIWFLRYNVAERAANQTELARRIAEGEQRRASENEAVAAPELVKRATLALPPSSANPVATAPETFSVFEDLRQRAERDVSTDDDGDRQRRPSCGWPLIIAGELLEACIELGLLKPDDTPIARLWAQFADPKQRGTVLREQRSSLPLSGIVCRGFELHAGAKRGATSDILFEAQRDKGGTWRFGPSRRVVDYCSPRRHKWEQAVRAHDTAVRDTWSPVDVQRLADEIAAIDAQDQQDAAAFYRRQQLWVRAVELARDRVLDFAGRPGVQMSMASRLWGHCFNCGKALTDPVSLERGIGPECLHGKVAHVWINHDLGVVVAALAFTTGMPKDFTTATLAAPRPRYRVPLDYFPRAYFEDGRCIVYRRDGPGVIRIFASEDDAKTWIAEHHKEKRHDIAGHEPGGARTNSRRAAFAAIAEAGRRTWRAAADA